MRAELKAGNTSIFSRALRDALAATLAAGEQAILFLNRRGSSTFVMCRDCGYVLRCRRCDNPLTYHADQDDLVCHHCSRRYARPEQCPNCLSRRIKQFGAGTQKVEEQVRLLFPRARTLRWDRDATTARGAHDRLLNAFQKHEDRSSATDCGLGTGRGSRARPLSKNETGAPAKPGRRSPSS